MPSTLPTEHEPAEHPPAAKSSAARWYSRLLPPALVLAAVVLAAGIDAALGPAGLALLLTGVVILPGAIYKGTKKLLRRRGIPDHRRTALVSALMLAAVVVCFLLPVPAPVPATVAGLLLGNLGLDFFRRWLNVSAHVSVLTFAVLWTTAVHGTAWAWLLLLSPLMILSRVSLRQHSLKEALSGAALGGAAFGCFLALSS